MCAACASARAHDDTPPTPAAPHDHPRRHDHGPAHDHPRFRDDDPTAPGRVVSVEAALARNDVLAGENRRLFASRRLAVFNLTSAPGSGKTTLIESIAVRLSGRVWLSVIEGDQATSRDAERVRDLGIPAVQINTRTGCHLDAEMIGRGVEEFMKQKSGAKIFGNLICPALFDLGERAKVAVLSVTEGDDKPLKYPHIFRAAGVLLLSKIDLLPHLDFDVEACLAHARRVNPALRVFQVSAKSGDGMAALCDWLAAQTQGDAA